MTRFTEKCSLILIFINSQCWHRLSSSNVCVNPECIEVILRRISKFCHSWNYVFEFFIFFSTKYFCTISFPIILKAYMCGRNISKGFLKWVKIALSDQLWMCSQMKKHVVCPTEMWWYRTSCPVAKWVVWTWEVDWQSGTRLICEGVLDIIA